MRGRSSAQDWLLLFFSLVLAFGGGLMLVHPDGPKERLVGFTCTLGFGLAAWVFAAGILRRRRDHFYAQAEQATLSPGVPLRMKRGRVLLLGAGAAGLGVLIGFCGRVESSLLLTGSGAVMALPGFALLFLVGTGLKGSNYLLFEAAGLRIGDRRGSVLLAWDNFAQLTWGEFQRNPVLYLWLVDLEAVARSAAGRGKRWTPAVVRREIGRNRGWMGCDWTIFPWHFGVDAALLAKAVATYVTDPRLRADLEEQVGAHVRLLGPP